jgi:hypothetical protein
MAPPAGGAFNAAATGDGAAGDATAAGAFNAVATGDGGGCGTGDPGNAGPGRGAGGKSSTDIPVIV